MRQAAKRSRLSVVTVTVLAAAFSMTALLGASALDPKKEPKEPKPAQFPLSLFKQATEDDYIGEKKCVNCHQPWAAAFERSAHASYVRDPHSSKDRIGCEACHGPGKIHIEHRENAKDIREHVFGYSRATAKQISAACLRCHADTMTEAHWRRTGHEHAGISCMDCHRIHQPDPNETETAPGKAPQPDRFLPDSIRKPIFIAVAEPKPLLRADEPTLCGRCHRRETGEFRHNFHHPVPEGRMTCSDCHSLHPTKNAHKLVAPGKNNCVTCHAEKAGPFVYEHDMLGGGQGQGCNECHRPHGSPSPKLLASFSRGLCAQCHTDKMISHHPGRSCWDAGCHVGIHGSNHDPNLLAP